MTPRSPCSRPALGLTRLDDRIAPSSGLPDLTGWPTPPTNPALPAAFAPFAPPTDALATPTAAGPAFGEWTKSAGPDQTLAVTGAGFSTFAGADSGKDSEFLAFGQTAAGNGSLRPSAVRRLDGPTAAVTLAPELPAGSVYLLWARTPAGTSRPAVVNKAEAWWVGPDQARPGQTTSVYGRNLVAPGGTSSYLYAEPAAGGAGFWLPVASANPYKLDVMVPATLATGDYRLWAHNGQGGKYGWADPLTLRVVAPWVRTGVVFNVRTYGAVGDGVTDDQAAIFAATQAAQASPGSTVYFPAGAYLVNAGFRTPAGVDWAGDGMSQSRIKVGPGFDKLNAPPGQEERYYSLLFGSGSQFEVRDLTLDGGGSLNGFLQGTLTYLRGSSDFRFTRTRLVADTPNALTGTQTYSPMDAHATNHAFLTGCEFVTSGGVFLGSSRQMFLDGNTFLGLDDCNELVTSWGGVGMSVTNNRAEDFDRTRPDGWAQGRFFVTQGHWGPVQNVYLGGNRTEDFSVRRLAWNTNTGEQILLENGYHPYRGLAAAATATTATLPGLTAAAALDSGNTVLVNVIDGRGLGQTRAVVGFDPATGTVTLDRPWGVVPDATSRLTVGAVVDRVAVVGNTLDGKREDVLDPTFQSASTGVSVWGDTRDLVVTGNTITDVMSGVGLWASQFGTAAAYIFNTNYFSQVTKNMIGRDRGGVYQQGQNWDRWTGTPPSADGRHFLGNVFAGNTFTDLRASAYGDLSSLGGRSIDLTVFEGNRATNLSQAFQFDRADGPNLPTGANQFNFVARGNTFDRGTAPDPLPAVGVNTGIGLPALSDNTFVGFPALATGPLPVIEAAGRVVRLAGAGAAAVPVQNAGTAGLTLTATTDAGWLTAVPPPGMVAAGATAAVQVTTNPAGLAPGVYTGTVTVAAAVAGPLFTTQTPTDPSATDGQPYELGTRVRAGGGRATALRFYKAVGETGPHTVRLWAADGTLLASAAVGGEAASGWQTVPLPTPVSLAAGAEYVVSVNVNSHYPYSPQAALGGVSSGSLTLVSGAFGLPGQFPTGTFGSVYFQDLVAEASTERRFTVRLSVAPAVAGVAVNDGAAQRSRVTKLSVTFNGAVTLAAGAFTASRVATAAGPLGTPQALPVGQLLVSLRPGTTATYDLTFTGGGLVESGSLADGVWVLTVNAAAVTAAAGGVAMAADAATPAAGAGRIHRLFGDANGDGVVNGTDLFLFRQAFGTAAGQPAYSLAFDFDGDGVVNGADLFQFRTRYGVSL